MYPFKFNPILKSTIWGGEKIIPFKGLDIEQPQVGESWEISNVPGDESVVANGAEAGKNLSELVKDTVGDGATRKRETTHSPNQYPVGVGAFDDPFPMQCNLSLPPGGRCRAREAEGACVQINVTLAFP